MTPLRKGLWTTTAPALPAAEGQGGGEALLASSEPSPQAAESLPEVSERKLVTVLCCALCPPPGLPMRGDLDTLHQQIQVLYAVVQREAQPYGGTVQPVVGEQVLVVFGAPAAQEDHAKRAVLVALGLWERLHTRRTTVALPDACLVGRISLQTGPVAIGGWEMSPLRGAARGSGGPADHLAAGVSPTLAGQVLCQPVSLVPVVAGWCRRSGAPGRFLRP